MTPKPIQLPVSLDEAEKGFRGLPPLKSTQEGELRREVDLAVGLFEKFLPVYYPREAILYRLDCSTAGPVFAAYLRHVLGVKAYTVLGIYVNENPTIKKDCGPESAKQAMEVAGKMASSAMTKRDFMKLKANEVEFSLLSRSIHEFVVVRRREGGFYYIDPTYRQFENPKHQEACVVDEVDAGKLREEYGLVLLDLAAQKTIRKMGFKVASNAVELGSLGLHYHKAGLILKGMVEDRNTRLQKP